MTTDTTPTAEQSSVDAYPAEWLAVTISRIREHPEMVQHHLRRLADQVEALETLCDETYVAQGADAYNHACDRMEQWQQERAKAGKEVGTTGSLCDGLEWLYHRLSEAEGQVEALTAERDAYKAECDTLTHKVICCGVAASHSDASLTTRGAYAGKWNSAQADQVRKLRAERDALRADAASDDVITLAQALEQRRAIAIAEEVQALPIGGRDASMPTPFTAGYQTACDEIIHRLRTEEWDNCLKPVGAARAITATEKEKQG